LHPVPPKADKHCLLRLLPQRRILFVQMTATSLALVSCLSATMAAPLSKAPNAQPPEVSPSPIPFARGTGEVKNYHDAVPKPPTKEKEHLEPSEELSKQPLDKEAEQTVRQLFAEGVELLKKNRAYEARACLEKAAYMAPRSAGIHCNLGLAYQNSGNINKAIGEFETALKLSASMPEATLNLAGCYQSVGDHENAINWYGKYLVENPKSSQAKQVEDIVEALKKSLGKVESDPHGPDYYSSITKEGVYRWATERMPLRIYIEPGHDVQGYSERFDDVLLSAFHEWCKAAGDHISVTRVSSQNQADIFCSWTSNPQEVTVSGTQGERGSARIIAKGNNILRATLKILTKPFLEEGFLSNDDLKKACLHEVGHVLGLQGHSNNNHDVMFFTVDTSTVWPVLTKRDKATMARLYAQIVKERDAASKHESAANP
jgi:tetratricopeptide (TPR) repeat protein